MTAVTVQGCVGVSTDVLSDYLDYVAGLGLSGRAVRDRIRIARRFQARHPDLAAWMARPAVERAGELRSSRAWPLLCYAIGAGRLRLDVELAAIKQLTGLGVAVEGRDSSGFSAMREAGNRLGWSSSWIETVLGECLAVLLACHGGLVADLTEQAIDEFDSALSASCIPRSSRRAYRARLASLRQLLYEVRVLDAAPRRRPWARSLEQRFTDVAMAATIRDTLLRYIRVRAAVLRPKSVESLINDLLPFVEYLSAHHPQLTSLRELDRACIEKYLAYNRTRGWRGQRAAAGAGRTVSAAVAQSAVLSLRNLLDDITAWGWEQAPPRRLVFAADVPKLDQPLPRALAPDIDTAVMNAVACLNDSFARIGLTVLRGAGLRVGELLDLELGSIIDYGAAGTWLKVPLGKLATERMVPLSAATTAALDEWVTHRGVHRPLTHPRTGVLTDFLFTHHGRRLGYARLRNGLLAAAQSAGLRGPDGGILVVTPHQLRHTWATELANAGMSMQALMALLGHVTPQMTIRYATLASPTLRAAYDDAMGKMRRQFTLTPVGRPILPDKVSWLHSEMLKTRVGHGYCARHPAAGACPYANICETCDNYIAAPEFRGALTNQLADVQALKVDADNRGWADEAARHDRVAHALTDHLQRLDRSTHPRATKLT
ncbi:tyrosine-type recombinase/integrase [Mycobacterium riyadhense]|uniref:tyrosine-type recombinase/integrase n=1 Tax=Mycobacterium riyadhense TaxID=486698 RepID=UPI00195D5399|nr:tyrosine-type recombinase/integrase [Mycobacterium riyadhense]